VDSRPGGEAFEERCAFALGLAMALWRTGCSTSLWYDISPYRNDRHFRFTHQFSADGEMWLESSSCSESRGGKKRTEMTSRWLMVYLIFDLGFLYSQHHRCCLEYPPFITIRQIPGWSGGWQIQRRNRNLRTLYSLQHPPTDRHRSYSYSWRSILRYWHEPTFSIFAPVWYATRLSEMSMDCPGRQRSHLAVSSSDSC